MDNCINTTPKLSIKEALIAAVLDYYDCAYAGTYEAHDSFMRDMFGGKRDISCDIMKEFCDCRLFEFSGFRFDHHSVCRKFDGDLVIRLYSIDRGAIIIEWFQKYGPVHAYWQ